MKPALAGEGDDMGDDMGEDDMGDEVGDETTCSRDMIRTLEGVEGERRPVGVETSEESI